MTSQATQPCGCIVTRHGGHTHTKLCKECQAKAFGTRAPEIYPVVPEVKEDIAWLSQ
jgi:hypothetical protein